MNKFEIDNLYQNRLNSDNPIYRYTMIDEFPDIEKYFEDSLYYEKKLNIWTVYFKQRPEKFLLKFGRYILGVNELSLEKQIINLLHERNLTLSTCESCTGGLIISRLISIPGASNVIKEAYVTYSDEAKIKILNVKKNTIRRYTVTSVEVAEEMVSGLYKISNANYCIGVTGFAAGESPSEDDGLFYFGILVNDNRYNEYVHLEKSQVSGNRDECRNAQVNYILWRTLLLLKG